MTIEQAWRRYVSRVLPPAIVSPVRLKEMQLAFYQGFLACLVEGSMVTKAQREEWLQECEAFLKEGG